MAKAKTTKPTVPAWKAAQRVALSGSRRPHPLDPLPPVVGGAEGRKTLVEIETLMEKGFGPVVCESRATKALYAPIRETRLRTEPPTALDPTTERLREAMLRVHATDATVDPTYQALIAFWAGTAGVGFILDVCRAPEPWNFRNDEQRTLTDPHANNRGQGWGRYDRRFSIALRRFVFALREADFEKVAADARAWLKGRSTDLTEYELRAEAAEIAFAFARDGAFANGLVTQALDDGQAYHCGSLLAATSDLALARRTVTAGGKIMALNVAAIALDVVETYGRDAAGLMEETLAATEGRSPLLKATYRSRLEAAKKLALTDPRPATP